jgi:hypothetical protein
MQVTELGANINKNTTLAGTTHACLHTIHQRNAAS